MEARGYGNVFADWLEIMLCALNSPAREDEYMKKIQPYSDKKHYDKRPIDSFAEAMASLMAALHKTNDDVLGKVYELYAHSSKSRRQALGQFFTPINISQMMAQIVCSPSDKPQSVCDPACGSGRMLIYAAKQLHPDSFFVGCDLDHVCADMTALNLLFFNMNGMVLCGDTLRQEFYYGYRTYRTVTGGILQKMSDEEVKQQSLVVVEKLQASSQHEEPQLTLF